MHQEGHAHGRSIYPAGTCTKRDMHPPGGSTPPTSLHLSPTKPQNAPTHLPPDPRQIQTCYAPLTRAEPADDDFTGVPHPPNRAKTSPTPDFLPFCTLNTSNTHRRSHSPTQAYYKHFAPFKCIHTPLDTHKRHLNLLRAATTRTTLTLTHTHTMYTPCLLYTSDAADD